MEWCIKELQTSRRLARLHQKLQSATPYSTDFDAADPSHRMPRDWKCEERLFAEDEDLIGSQSQHLICLRYTLSICKGDRITQVLTSNFWLRSFAVVNSILSPTPCVQNGMFVLLLRDVTVIEQVSENLREN